MTTNVEDPGDVTLLLPKTPPNRRASAPAPAAANDTAASRGTATATPTDPVARTDEPGSHIGRYLVLEQVGAGGMGVVHRAYDPKLRREVALKMLRFDRRVRADASRAGDRFFREAQAMAQLSHPNVLPVYDVEQAGELVFISMEYVDGETLSRWIRHKTRTWQEVIERLRPAGQGLWAAHQAGIIHRDFKPSNVLLSSKGRVLVTDFGLARAHDGDEVAPDASGAWHAQNTRDADSLTELGEVVGTPPYMAPEQLRGDPLDARADQYAFCVTLYEGLYGRRPFTHRDPMMMLEAKEGGDFELPSSTHVPAWLLRVIERGMAPKADDRFATMDELLLQLDHDPTRARRRWLWLGSGVLLGAGALGLQLAAAPERPACPEPSELVEQLWGAQQREQSQAALLATGRSYAADTARRVNERLDAYAQAWAKGYVDACQATHVRREQSAEAFDLRMACLGRQRTELETTVETLTGEVNVGTLRRATSLVAALPSPRACADVEALRSQERPADPRVAEQIEQLRLSLARAQVLARAGRNDDANDLADRVRKEADGLSNALLRGEARLLQGHIQSETRQLHEAERTLRAAFADAVEARDAALAVEAALQQGTIMGLLQTRSAEAEHWAYQAETWLRGADAQDPRLGELWLLQGGIHQVAGRLEEAREDFTRVAGLLQTQPDTNDLAEAYHTLGLALAALGEFEGAERQFRAEMTMRESLDGAEHPDVARALQSLAGTLYVSGDPVRALPLFERSLHIFEAALGPDHPRLVTVLGNLAALRDDLGEYDDARELFQRALSILESSEDTGSTAMVRLRGNLALTLRHAGEYQAAVEHLREAATLIESEHGPAHPDRVELITRQGEILLEAGDRTNAREALEAAAGLRTQLPEESSLVAADTARALSRLRHQDGEFESAQALLTEAIEHYRSLGPTLDPRRGEALLERGTVRLAKGDAPGAREDLEVAIGLLADPSVPAPTLARARFALARALGPDPADRERALQLAQDARPGLADDATAQAELDAWLATLGD